MPWLTAAGVADYISVSRPTVYALVERGVLPRPTYLSPQMPRWKTDDIDRAITYRGARESLSDAIEKIGVEDRQADAGRRQRQGVPVSKVRAA